MGLIQLPAARLRGHVMERSALRQGIAQGPPGHLRVIRRLPATSAVPALCDSCARPIDLGAEFPGTHFYCSAGCSQRVPRPPAV